MSKGFKEEGVYQTDLTETIGIFGSSVIVIGRILKA